MLALRLALSHARWSGARPRWSSLRPLARRALSLFSKSERLVELERQLAENPEDLYTIDIYLKSLAEEKYFTQVLDFLHRNRQYLKSDAIFRTYLLAACHTGDIYSLEMGESAAAMPKHMRDLVGAFGRPENPLPLRRVRVSSKRHRVVTIIALVVLLVMIFPDSISGMLGLKLPMGKGLGVQSTTLEPPGKVRLEDVKGIEDIKNDVSFLIHYLRNPDKVLESGATIPHGVLLSGPPGCGKTMLARAMSGEAGVPFFYMSGSSFDEVFVGMGARRMRALFEEAKQNAPCIIFIDEFDAVAGRRQTGPLTRSVDHLTINQLLTEMDGFLGTEGIIVIAATNIPSNLDPAVTRSGRFDLKMELPLPDLAARIAMLKRFTEGKRLGADLDLEQFARNIPGATGADLENIINQSLLMMAIRKEDVLTSEILNEVYEKVLFGKARSNQILPQTSLGMVTFHLGEEDIYQQTKQSLKAEMLSSVAGRVSEELRYGHTGVTTGAASDYQHASELARAMVMLYGMNSRHGLEYVNGEHSDIVSPASKEIIDHEAHAILTRYPGALEEIAQMLLSKETAMPAELQEIVDRHGVQRESPFSG